MTIESNGSDTAFQFGVTLSSSNDFAAGKTYSNPDGSGEHSDMEAVWVYSSSEGYGDATVSVTSTGRALMNDGGDGSIYYSQAYGDAVIDLAAADPPYATGTVTATIHWVTMVVAPPLTDGGADAARDASHKDAAEDGESDGSQTQNGGKCGVKLSGATTTDSDGGLPCTSTMTYFPDQNFTVLRLLQSGDGGSQTVIAIQFPGLASELAGGRTSASMCSPTGSCVAAVSVSDGSGDAGETWSRMWASSDIGKTPWFDLSFTTYGTCPDEGLPDDDPCAGYTGSFSATLPPVSDGGPSLSVSIPFF
jgi:hypothetical protein